MLHATYVLPIKWSADLDRRKLATYLQQVAEWTDEVIVVDGSSPADFESNAAAWGQIATHLPPDSDLSFLNGKVAGVTTGIRAATQDLVVIADDDVRYEPTALRRAVELLNGAEIVRPQNFFERPMPWHAALDTARTLLNRAFGVDFPGTLAVRRSFFLEMGGYDGDVLFENLELMRTVERHGGRVAAPLDLYVARLPPTTQRFLSQRIRQAYDDFALPLRMTLWLSCLPAIGALLLTGKRRWSGLIACAAIGAAEMGRQKGGGRRVFPMGSSLLAPVWLAERGVCAWLAVGSRLRGGVPYGDRRIKTAANRR